jgi:PPOX class probable F420-dependent enzyme
MGCLDLGDPKQARVDGKLRTEVAVWLTTVTSDGQPQSTPVWFRWDGDTFLIYSQPDRPKVRNIASDPKVSLHLVGDTDGEDAITFEEAVVDPSAPADQLAGYMVKYTRLVEVRMDAGEHGGRLLRGDPRDADARAHPVGMLELLDLSRRFGDIVALDGVVLDPRRRDRRVRGTERRGKTTTMRIALGVLEPDAGDVRWNGLPIDAERDGASGTCPRSAACIRR